MFVKEINVLPYYEQSTLLSQDTCNLLHVMSQNCNTCDLTGKLNLCVAGGTVEKKPPDLPDNINDLDISFVISWKFIDSSYLGLLDI